MKVFGIGIDMVDLNRVKIIYSKYGDKFAKKILNHEEFEGYTNAKNKPSFLAKRFAAKEAIGKALGVGIMNGFLLKNISIRHNESGKPTVKLSGKKELQSYMDKEFYISISDEKNFAVANALILEK
jgi:holo-[acyl-carrier protein] synthase|tara:strand:- start:664 stop:1041 length:378 start_codon:yes stop_codon:yes gene_type:complete